MRKKKEKTWATLKVDKCPKCGEPLMTDMFEGKILGCGCGFTVTKSTKELLVERDHNDK